MKTKQLFSILLGMPLIACLTACTSDETTEAKPAQELLMVEKDISFPASETSRAVKVTADCHWDVTAVESGLWDDLTVSPRSGDGDGTLVFTSGKNRSSVDRVATVILTSKGGLNQRLTIRQTKSDAALSINNQLFSFDPNGGTANLVISSNSNWEITGADGIDWLVWEQTSGGSGTTELNFQVKQAYNENERTADLSVTAGSNKIDFHIDQAGLSNIALLVNPADAQRFPAAGGTQIYSIISNAAWYVYVPTSANWIHVEPTFGLSNGEIRVTVEDNPSVRDEREAVFIVTAGAKTVLQSDIRVTQAPAEEVIIPEDPHNPNPNLSR